MKTSSIQCAVCLCVVLFAAGCGGGSSSTPPPPALSVAIGGGQSTIVTNGTFLLTATVFGDLSGSGVSWVLSGPGTLSLQSGTTASYKAPAMVPASPMVTITATSVADGTKSNELSFSIVANPDALNCQPSPAPRGNESALSTPVAFLLKGTESDESPIAYVGSFTADGDGGVTAGDVDVVGFDGGSEELPVIAKSSTYSYGSDGRGCLYLQFETANSQKAPAKAAHRYADARHDVASNGFARRARSARSRTSEAIHTAVADGNLSSLTLSFVLSSPTGPGRIIEFGDGGGNGMILSGQMHAQSPADFSVAKLSSKYAFGADGWSPTFYRTAIAGSFVNTAGNWSLGVADGSFDGIISGMVTGGEGGVDATIDSATGRGTGSYETGKSGGVAFDFTFYMVDGGDLYFISSDDPNDSDGLLAGRALASAAVSIPLNGYYITASSGLGFCESCDSLGGNTPAISTMHATSAGLASGTISALYFGFTSTTYSWSYTLDAASGRVAFAGGASLPIAYLTSGSTDDGVVAFTVGTDDTASSGFIASAGTSEPNYSATSLSGAYAYGSAEDAGDNTGASAGVVTFDGTSGYSATVDAAVIGSQGITYNPNVKSAGTYLVNSDGTGTLDNNATHFVTNGNLIVAYNATSLKMLLYIYIKQSTAKAAIREGK